MTIPETPQELLAQALAHQQAGRIAEAEEHYRRLLRRQPEHPPAIFLFGLCHHQRGDHASAITLMDMAIEMNPAMPQAHYNRGLVLQALGRDGEAVAAYDRALALQPGHAGAWNNRGNALKNLGRLPEALESYGRAIALRPDFAEAHTNRGNVLKKLKRLPEALAGHDEALGLRPDYAEAHCNRGNVLKAMKRYPEALAAYDRALALKAGYLDALVNRGDTCHEMGRKDEALACYDRAIALQPDGAEAYEMRGNLLMTAREYEAAGRDLEAAARLDPARLTAVGQLLHARMLLCDWAGMAPLREKVLAGVEQGVPALHPFAALSILPAAELQLRATRQFAGDWFPADPEPLWRGEAYRHDRLRIGYFSSDLRNHAVAYLTAGLFEHHDRGAFEIHAFYLGPPVNDPYHRRIRVACDRFHDVHALGEREIARLARELEIDIAVDLNGHTEGGRLDIFASRPVPIQVSYLGHPGTLGVGYMDYIVADPIVIPEASRRHYSEKVVWLPRCFQINDDRKAVADPGPGRRQLGLPENTFVYCCFNNSYKITPEVFDIWMRLLHQVEGSVLWLSETGATAAGNLRREAVRRGVPAERLVFSPRLPLADYLAAYRCADLFLDTFCYNAGTTASDALWAGLPVLTLPGNAFAQRMAASLVAAAGLPELAVSNASEYEAVALELARHPEKLAELRRRLQNGRDALPLFSTAATTRHLEAAFRQMQARREAGQPPDHIAVGW